MYDFKALGSRLAEKHGLYKVDKKFETDYFLIKDTSFVWSEVLRTFEHNNYVVFFNILKKLTYNEKMYSESEYEYCFGFNADEMTKLIGKKWSLCPIDNQFKQEHFEEYPEIDIEDCLDKMLETARKDLNELIIDNKKSEIKGAGGKYIL